MWSGAAAVENSMAVLQKLKVELLYEPAVSLLDDIYPKELKAESQRDICMPVFIASLFTTAKRWKQLPSIYRWMNKQNMVFTNNQMLL